VPVGVLAALLYQREPAPVFLLFFGLLVAQVLMAHAIGRARTQLEDRVAALIRRQCRAADIIARYGGEEFALLIPETPLEGAVRLAEDLRAALERHAWDAIQRDLRVTMSFGVAQVVQVAEPAVLVGYADDLLYLAKHNGRNRVESGAR
jgi:diguanylate cyclase (GGDEF)-like protein